MKTQQHSDTIAAVATPSGRGGVGIIRISGPLAPDIAVAMLGKLPKVRFADYAAFRDQDDNTIDMGLALYFAAPNSFTGEDVLELQGHGGPVVLDGLLKSVMSHGARIAKPVEFSERAFLNNKIDLTQAEAIADLIDSSSEQAARFAMKSLQGEFSNKINTLLEQLIRLRLYCEAAIDFPEEEIDFLSDGKVEAQLNDVLAQVEKIKGQATRGAILREGMTMVIAGQPNAGKSTLLNALSGRESAIVTEIPGTTRDVMREQILIEGIPFHIIDTAGLRESSDPIEQEGIRRAFDAIEKADVVCIVTESGKDVELESLIAVLPKGPRIIIKNKIDIHKKPADIIKQEKHTTISLSAKTGEGLELLRAHLKQLSGLNNQEEGGFIARRRHIEALIETQAHLLQGMKQLKEHKAGELLAEDLRLAQCSLSKITGEFTSDDLLGEIFSQFCIGK